VSEFNEGGTLLPWITLNVTIFGTCTLDEKCWVSVVSTYSVNVGELSVEMKCISLTVLTCTLWARIYYYFFSFICLR